MSGDLFFYGLIVLAMIAVLMGLLTGNDGTEQNERDDNRRP